ncbi:hypothetical protein QYM36_001315 [Artemia franciscana]|uniref:Uncharacterized protein n=1 Tax=Artemia franciscana TaxID=6661 RepID=A0AA88IB26_ARTSF|nr:hypothetical protein QYM36_001315 [Artemia franciscana]
MSVENDGWQPCSQFFKPEAIFQAKELLWSLASVPTCMTKRYNHQDNVLDLIRVLRSCDKKHVSLPCFAISEPDEVPILSSEVTATIMIKVNKLCMTFQSYVASERA